MKRRMLLPLWMLAVIGFLLPLGAGCPTPASSKHPGATQPAASSGMQSDVLPGAHSGAQAGRQSRVRPSSGTGGSSSGTRGAAAAGSGWATKASAMTPAQVQAALGRLRNGAKPVIATVRPYRVTRRLAHVRNARDFRRELSPKLRKILAKNGFVAQPASFSQFRQLYEVYEANEYARPHRYPSFITTDALLQAYHMLFDRGLELVEQKVLARRMSALSHAMVRWCLGQARRAANPVVKQAALDDAAFFAVAQSLLTGRKVPRVVAGLVRKDLTRIMAHAVREPSAILGVPVDFTMFVPRGHYTRTGRLKRYFRGMMWYGLASMPLMTASEGVDSPQGRATLRALLMTRGLYEAKVGRRRCIDLWNDVYRITSKFVGPSDDLTPVDFHRVMVKVWTGGGVDGLASAAKIKRFAALGQAFSKPRIVQVHVGESSAAAARKKFRLMGQRFIFDSYLLQNLVHPKVAKRMFPTALDVPAVFGSDRAAKLAEAKMAPAMRQAYQKTLARLRAETAAVSTKTWDSNLYWGWLATAAALLMDVPKGYPSFMMGAAWRDKSLVTFLGSWTELRHNTVLYAKQSGAECGGDEDEPPMAKGYVEPNVELWTRLQALAQATRLVLTQRHPASGLERVTNALKDLEKWAAFCRRVSIAELTGHAVTHADYKKMTMFGAELESMHAVTVAGDAFKMLTPSQRHMGLVVDVHKAAPLVLEEAVGGPALIYVVVPKGRGFQIARGAMFTQYEFAHAASDRMTDEAWKAWLKRGKLPQIWPWLKSFFVGRQIGHHQSHIKVRLPEC